MDEWKTGFLLSFKTNIRISNLKCKKIKYINYLTLKGKYD